MAKQSAFSIAFQLLLDRLESNDRTRSAFSLFYVERFNELNRDEGRLKPNSWRVSPTLWNSWKNGSGIPNKNYLAALAAFISARSRMRPISYEQALGRLEKACGVRSEVRHLTVSRVDHMPFCSVEAGHQGMLDRTFARYVKLDRLEVDWTTHRSGGHGGVAQDAVQDLLDGKCDVAISFFETIPRSEQIHCFHSSMRTTLNAVCLVSSAGDLSKLEELQEALTQPDSSHLLGNRKILVAKNESAYQYLIDSNFPEKTMEVVSEM
ncbi:MAG: hypothetical protein NTZ94_16240, partial [Verrucomicrobia bacterium]|nr:hypothetical protein [Verrucomicrobiota bacterium]